MVGRSVAKLLTEAYLYKIPSYKKRRSLSTFNLIGRNVSEERTLSSSNRRTKSTENLSTESDLKVDSHTSLLTTKRQAYHRFESAKKFGKIKQQEEEAQEDEDVYEVSDRTHYEDKPTYDVFNLIRKREYHRSVKGFQHLQPSNLRPYGAQCQHYPSIYDTRPRVMYPIVTDPQEPRVMEQQKEQQQYESPRESAFSAQKDYPGYEDNSRKVVVYENSSSHDLVSRKHFSTHCLKKMNKKYQHRPSFTTKQSKHTLALNVKSKPALTFTKVKEHNRHISKFFNSKPRKVNEVFFDSSRFYDRRKFNTLKTVQKSPLETNVRVCALPEPSTSKGYCAGPLCSEGTGFITVKLGELKEECIKQKKCKAKKIKFGKLPKLEPPDCPCIEDIPLKEGKPINRLPRRKLPAAPPRDCVDTLLCNIPRADANYKIKPKVLPQIKVEDCPCVETKLVDFKFKRLPKRKVAEPKRVCPRLDDCQDDLRADFNLKVESKILPKLVPGECPCIEPIQLKEVPLARLKPKKVSYQRLCLEKKLCTIPRADANLRVTPKKLPSIKALCHCVEAEPLKDVPPLKRLGKIKYVEKPKICITEVCDESMRADSNKKYSQKKLPVFKPQSCPCIEEKMPDKMVNLKRLGKRIIKAKPNICPDLQKCNMPRADDGMKIRPKKLPQIKEVDCPCEEIVMKDVKPLRRLIPKPVLEPKRPDPCPPVEVCPPRSDKDKKIEAKTLPVLPPGSCPCVEPEPLKDMPPLNKLRKRKVRPPLPCPPDSQKCTIPRADATLKIRPKKLPKIEQSNCPCIEAPVPEDVKPLTRLKKVHIPEPVKVCPKLDDCEETPRADENDWMYWKRCAVQEEEGDHETKPGTRSYSTFAPRHGIPGCVKLRYEAVTLNLSKNFDGKRAYSMFIDVSNPGSCSIKEVNNSGETCEELSKSRAIVRVDSRGSLSNSTGSALVRFLSTTNVNQKANVEDYLQPRNQKSPEMIEKFLIYPDEKLIENATIMSKKYCRENPEVVAEDCYEEDDECDKEEAACQRRFQQIADECETVPKKQLTLWERIVNFFKARDCPSPEEFKKIRLREDAERAASKAGLCLYDPKELLKKNEKEMPKIITGKDVCDEK